MAGVAPPRRTRVLAVALAVLGAVLAGCGTVVPGRAVADPVPAADRALVDAYVDAVNRAGDAGTDAQTAFLRSTQEPGVPFPPARCFGTVAVHTRLVERTLRPAPTWTVPGPDGRDRRPDGAVYVVAASVTATRDGTAVREDVGSKHLVVRRGRVYGYAPCPS